MAKLVFSRSDSSPHRTVIVLGVTLASLLCAAQTRAQPAPEPSSARAPAEKPPAAAASDEKPPAAAARDEKPPAAAANDEKPPAAAANDEKPPAAAASDAMPPAAAARDEKPPAAAARDEKPPAAATANNTSPAPSASDDGSEPAWQRQKAVRRSGFTAGVSLGPSLGGAAGFPNDSRKIGRTPYYTETGPAGGGTATGWIGVALSDWLNFGLGGSYGMTFGGGAAVESAGILFRVEGFPLWPLGGALRDIGLNMNGGVGIISAASTDNPDMTLIDGGLASWIGVGAFYEGIHFWRLSMGPFAVYDYMWSSSVKLPIGTLGWRTTLYAGP